MTGPHVSQFREGDPIRVGDRLSLKQSVADPLKDFEVTRLYTSPVSGEEIIVIRFPDGERVQKVPRSVLSKFIAENRGERQR